MRTIYFSFFLKVTKNDFDEFDYVLCMDESNLSDLKVN